MNIHPTAIVSNSAQLGKNVSIGAYSIIEDDVIIGDSTAIRSHCVIGAGTIIGKNNRIYASVVIGTEPQDLKHNGERTGVVIGDNNLFREFVTINSSTNPKKPTTVGNNNALLAYCHIAHDNVFGNNIVMSNVVQLGGHVVVEDNVVFGGCSAVHQFCRVGKFSMIGANAVLTKDATPFSTISHLPSYNGINKIGLTRNGFDEATRREITEFYNMALGKEYNTTDGIAKYLEEHKGNILPEVQYAIDFITISKRGIYRFK